MSQLSIQEPQFRELLSYEPMLKQLSPIAQLDDLNAFLICWGGESLSFIVREPLAFVQITLPCKIIYYGDGPPGNLGIAFNYQLFLQTLHAYSLETLATMTLAITFGEKSVFRLSIATDRIALPHVALTAQRIEELRYESDVAFPDAQAFQLSSFNDEKGDFLKGIENCMDFVSTDDRKNNAFALYDDRMVVNDLRHVFIYRYNHVNPLLPHSEPVSLHKRAAKLFLTLSKKGVVFDATIAGDGKRIFVVAPNLQAILNNAISNIAPPNEEELAMISPRTWAARGNAKVLMDTAAFFSGFYKSSQEYKSLRIEVENAALRFQLRDDGVSDFTACNVERTLVCETNEKPAVVDILNDSLLAFLHVVAAEETVEIWLDEQPSFLLSTEKRRIFMSKLN